MSDEQSQFKRMVEGIIVHNLETIGKIRPTTEIESEERQAEKPAEQPVNETQQGQQ